MEMTTERDAIADLVAGLAGATVFHLESDIVQCAVVESCGADEWGIVLECRPLTIPGLPVPSEESFELMATWQVLATYGPMLYAYHASWQLIVEPGVVQHGIVAAAAASDPEAAAQAVLRLAR